MARRLFLVVDPNDLERYTKKKVPRRTRRPLEVQRKLDVMKRALQSLPPRELYMLYTVRVLRVEQEEISDLLHVRQSNISYRLERANYRIRLHTQMAETCSESSLRRVLYDVGVPEASVRAVLGVVKTTSQSATAEALGVTQGSVRHVFATTKEKLAEYLEGRGAEATPRECSALALLELVETNFNQLRSIRVQDRWQWKMGYSNYLTPKKAHQDSGDKKVPVDVPVTRKLESAVRARKV